MLRHRQYSSSLNHIRAIVRQVIREMRGMDFDDGDIDITSGYDSSMADDEQRQHLSGYDAAYTQQTVRPDSADHDYIEDVEKTGMHVVRRRDARKKV